MKQVTKEMIKEYKLKELGYDFMGYTFNKEKELSFHHLIIGRQYCNQLQIGRGYEKWNGAILTRDTAHDYLHLIQNYDEEIFLRITSEMIDENIKGKIDIKNLKKIRNLLLYFEYEHQNTKNCKNKPIIRESFKTKRLSLEER